MLNFNGYNILAGIIFGGVGWGAWRYGKALGYWKPVAIGVALSFYSYFIPNVYATWAVGIALCVLLWFHHDE